MTMLALGIAVVAAAGVLFIMYGLTATMAPKPGELLEARLAQFTETGRMPTTLTEVELSLPLFERVLRPALDKLGGILNRRAQAGTQQALQERLNLAGKPWGLTPSGFVAVRLLSVVLFTGICTGLTILEQFQMPMLLLGPVGGLVLGYLMPQLMVSRRIKKRQKEILLAMPSALDLLTISVEAGLSFDAALSRVADKYHNALTHEITQVLNEVRLGRPRLEALDDMARRCKVDELNTFVQAIIQSEQLGVGVANVLRIQSEEIRRRRRQRAEELGQKAPLKMLFPMVGCIFPTLFIVLLGPAVIEVVHDFMGK
ncbi:MAG: type II secretion system F family protein [Candidatus Dormibacteraeota bacterium]|nr:type II secretion system F family protein [Candidatus Dormibacteraeota bacterium]MBV8445116.1 type II secretion system F family protein [Candidatus Dormibacteraeota bacterium]